jgi:GAF domain-containing protein
VATQVAAAAPPNAVFAGVAEEVGRLLSVDRAYVARYDPDGAVTVVAAWSATGETLPLGPIGRTQGGQLAEQPLRAGLGRLRYRRNSTILKRHGWSPGPDSNVDSAQDFRWEQPTSCVFGVATHMKLCSVGGR